MASSTRLLLESSKLTSRFEFDRYDTYQWYLRLGALSNVDAKYFHGKLPTWNNFVAHPDYDKFWQDQALVNQLKKVTVPIMHVAGWWDQEDFYGPVKAYEILEKTDSNHFNYLVVGPWNHGGWNRLTGDKLGNIDFGSPASQYFRANIFQPWFAYYLKDKGQLRQPEATTFETGSNRWTSFDSWPRAHERGFPQPLFSGARPVVFRAAARQTRLLRLMSTFQTRRIRFPTGRARLNQPTIRRTWVVRAGPRGCLKTSDLSKAVPTCSPGKLSPLQNDTVIAGDIVAHLFASTSGTDSDWVVKLIDVYPETYPKDPKMSGYQLMIANEILRGRYRNSFTKPEAIPSNQVIEYAIDLHTSNHAFLKGHRIMVQVQSTWFPIYDRNPQKFVDNIFLARDSDYVAATQKVFRSSRYPSHVTIPTIR